MSYKGACVPAYDKPFAVEVDDISVSPFTGEIHSTVDYNGIAVAGTIQFPIDKLSIETLSDRVLQISRSVQYPIYSVCFIPLTSEG